MTNYSQDKSLNDLMDEMWEIKRFAQQAVGAYYETKEKLGEGIALDIIKSEMDRRTKQFSDLKNRRYMTPDLPEQTTDRETIEILGESLKQLMNENKRYRETLEELDEFVRDGIGCNEIFKNKINYALNK